MIARYLRSLWIWIVTAALFLVWVPVMAVVRLFDRDPLVRRTGRTLRMLGRLILRSHRPGIRFAGFENIRPGQNYVIVANHQSFIDISLVSWLPVDTKCLARSNLFRVPWVGWTLRMSKEIAVDRKDPRNAARAMLHCARVLKGGCSVLIYAEGTRSPDGNLLPFSEGPFQLAIRLGVPVLPVVIDGSGLNLGKNAALFDRKQPMSMTVLEPVPTDGWSAKQAAELRDLVRDRMRLELERGRTG
jgi:1-acyl-sn-glycerol-3-phosphate acyltransferase